MWSFGGRQRSTVSGLSGVLIALATRASRAAYLDPSTHIFCVEVAYRSRCRQTRQPARWPIFADSQCSEISVGLLSPSHWLRQICADFVHGPCWPYPGTSWTWGIVGRSLSPSDCRFLLGLRWGWSGTDPPGFAWSSLWFDDQCWPAGKTDTVLQGETRGTVHTYTHMLAHLSWRLSINELFIDLVCFGDQLGGALGLLVLFTGHPKLDVLITELALEERAEGGQAIWRKKTNGGA